MTAARQILFVQGAGAEVHDEWDAKLVASLAHELADGYEIRYPRMPREDDPSYARWSAAIGHELATAEDGVVVVGHSVGGTILIAYVAERPPERRLGGIVLIDAPFVGAGGWPGDEFVLTPDLGARLPNGVPVHLFHGLNDQIVPRNHVELYLRAVPQAQLHLLPGLDHQLDNDLSEVARAVTTDQTSSSA